MGIVIFFLVLFALILVHEWGHFIVAKKTGMRVDEFGIGFPPKLFGKKWGGTEYSLNALPIGGFVRIFGENSEDAESAAKTGEVISDSFTSKSKWAQAAVLIAGVTMNIIFAWFLIAGALVIGVPTSVNESTASDKAQLLVSGVVAGSPAGDAAIPVGASIQSIQAGDFSENNLTPTSFKAFTETHKTEALTIVYKDGDEAVTVSLEPTTGLIDEYPEQAAIGVALSMVENRSLPIHLALYEATLSTYDSLIAITVGLSTLVVQSVQGSADFSQVAGPIGIAGLVGDAAEFGITSLMLFTAMISLNLAIINMLPFPALDGGRLVFVAVEAVIRRPINPVWVARVNLLGFASLMLLMIAVTYSDIAKIL